MCEDRPTRAEIEREEAPELIECVWCGQTTDPAKPCHDQETGE